jgi:hypothetical protein
VENLPNIILITALCFWDVGIVVARRKINHLASKQHRPIITFLVMLLRRLGKNISLMFHPNFLRYNPVLLLSILMCLEVFFT